MIKRWFCLLLALAVGWASVCCAEEIVIEGEAVIAEAAEDELVIGELDEDIELPPIGDLALELPDDGGAPGLLDDGLIAEGEWALDGDRETAEAELEAALRVWQADKRYAHVFLRHAEIDCISDAFFALQQGLRGGDGAELGAAYDLLRYHLECVDSMEHISPGSVF